MIIDTKTYKVEAKNYYKSISEKKQIILCGSLRKSNFGIIHMQHKEYGNTKKWNAFTISREGKIYRHYDPKYYTDFIGIKEIDRQAITIVLENLGGLFKISEEEYINWINESCDSKNVYKRGWTNYMYWEKYYEPQINATAELCNSLCETFKIRKKVIGFNSYHKDIIKFNGIISKSNYFETITDLNPSFDFEEFQKKLTGNEEV